MTTRLTLTQKIALLNLPLILGSAFSIWLLGSFVSQTKTDVHFMNAAGRQRMLAVEVREWAHKVAEGQDGDRSGLLARIVEFETTLIALRRGGAVMDYRLGPPAAELRPELDRLAEQWSALKPDLVTIASVSRTDASLRAATYHIGERLEGLRSRSHAVVLVAEARNHRLNHRVLLALGATAVGFCFVFMASIMLTRRYIARPINEATRAARRISEGDLSQRLDISSGDEIAALGMTFNEMAERLDSQIATMRLLSTAVSHAGDALFVTDPQGSIVFVNREFEAMTGYSAHEAIGSTPRILKSGEHDAEFYREMWLTLRSGETYRGVLVNRRKDGTLYHSELSVAPVRDDRGVVSHFVATTRDITARVLIVERLRRANRALDTLGQVHMALLIESDEGALLTRVCRTAVDVGLYRLVGVQIASGAGIRPVACVVAGELSGDTLAEAWVQGWECERSREVLVTGRAHIEPDVQRCSCPEPWRQEAARRGITSMICLPLVSDENLGVVVLCSNDARAFDQEEVKLLEEMTGAVAKGIATLRVRAEHSRVVADRNAASERFQAIFDYASDAIFVSNAQTQYTDVNEMGVALVGYSREELLNMRINDLLPAEDLVADPPRLGEVRHDRPLLRKRRLRRKDGSLVCVEISAKRLPDGGFLGMVRDMSERERAEKELHDVEAQLAQAQKMDAIGRLAGGVAHDFNNLLTVILSYASFAIDGAAGNGALIADIGEVIKAGQRAAALTRQLLAFSRKSELQPKVLCLNNTITDMQRLLERVIGEHIRLSSHLHSPLWNVQADPTQIEQILLNLAVNARDAMPSGGPLSLETANVVVAPSFVARHPGLKPGRYVTMSVTDEGVGMSRDVMEHIFEPFFTTKEKAKGTGLGLATVFGAVKQSGGYVQVESEPDKGSCFTVYLPATDAALSSDRLPQSQRERGERGTVLVVEDEDAVRGLTVRMLTRNGFRVVEAANAGEALLVCEQSEHQINLVLSDVIMPRMSGREITERLKARWPELRVVYMSGHTDEEIGQHGLLDPALPFLAKPFTEAQLLSVLDRALG